MRPQMRDRKTGGMSQREAKGYFQILGIDHPGKVVGQLNETRLPDLRKRRKFHSQLFDLLVRD